MVAEAASGRAPLRAPLAMLALEVAALGLGRPGRHGSAERGPDGSVLAELGARLQGIVPEPVVPFTEEEPDPPVPPAD